jgi:hypothetical protein
MAISSKIEEIILELSKTAGNIYDALSLGLGDFNQPNSSIFEMDIHFLELWKQIP